MPTRRGAGPGDFDRGTTRSPRRATFLSAARPARGVHSCRVRESARLYLAPTAGPTGPQADDAASARNSYRSSSTLWNDARGPVATSGSQAEPSRDCLREKLETAITHDVFERRFRSAAGRTASRQETSHNHGQPSGPSRGITLLCSHPIPCRRRLSKLQRRLPAPANLLPIRTRDVRAAQPKRRRL